MTTAVVDVTVPAFNTGAIEYHVYLGDHGPYYVGVAGVIKALNETVPAVTSATRFMTARATWLSACSSSVPCSGQTARRRFQWRVHRHEPDSLLPAKTLNNVADTVLSKDALAGRRSPSTVSPWLPIFRSRDATPRNIAQEGSACVD